MTEHEVEKLSKEELSRIVKRLYDNKTQANLYFSIKRSADKLSKAVNEIEQFDLSSKEGKTLFDNFMSMVKESDGLSKTLESIRSRIDDRTYEEERARRESEQPFSPEFFAIQNRDKQRFDDELESFGL